MPADRVVAVVVTYRRTELLRRCVDSVLGQTRPPELVLVVDNGGLAREVLGARSGVEIVETGENLGPAGGYEVGFREALEREPAWIWAVDDDVEPEDDCLQLLLAAGETGRARVLMPRQLKPGGERGFPPSWNGPLVAADVVRRIGLPRGDLFFWAEDTEYFHRAREAGFPRTGVPDAVVHHRNPEDRARGSARDWRLYYEVRNTLELRLRIRRLTTKGALRALGAVLRKLGAIVFLEPNKGRSLRLWWWGVRDFARHRMGRVVDPETWNG